MKPVWIFATAALLAGCGGGGDWGRPGFDEARTAHEYQDCRDMAATTVQTDADIDQDILATRGQDWQRSGFGRVAPQAMRDHTRDRAAGIVASCMRAKGFTKVR